MPKIQQNQIFSICAEWALKDVEKRYHHSCIEKTVLSQVSNSTHEVKYSISHGDNCIFREDDCLASISWNCKLCKYDSGHASIDDDSNDALD
jgi:hypothetical protein